MFPRQNIVDTGGQTTLSGHGGRDVDTEGSQVPETHCDIVAEQVLPDPRAVPGPGVKVSFWSSSTR